MRLENLPISMTNFGYLSLHVNLPFPRVLRVFLQKPVFDLPRPNTNLPRHVWLRQLHIVV